MADMLQNYIDGKFVDAADGTGFDVFNPATGEVIATAPDSKQADVDAAVSAARRTFDDGTWWPRTTERERGRILLRAADIVRREHEHLAQLESLDSGKPIGEAREDIAEVAFMFEYYGGWATKIYGDIPPVGPDAMSLVVKEPMGVAAAITPWNYPMMMAVQKVAPAIAAGCTVILKPAEQTPLTALEIPKILEEAGLARRRAERAHRVRRDVRRAAHVAPERRQGRVHRLEGRRQDHHADRRGHAEARHARARRQVAEHRVRRRGVRRGDPGERERHLLEPGRDLLGGLARVRRARDLRRRAERAGRPRAGRDARRRQGRGHDDGAARVEGAAGARAVVHRDRPGRGEDGRAGRRADRPEARERLLRAADDLRRRRTTTRGSRARRSSGR